jgi:hypothetical protein
MQKKVESVIADVNKREHYRRKWKQYNLCLVLGKQGYEHRRQNKGGSFLLALP